MECPCIGFPWNHDVLYRNLHIYDNVVFCAEGLVLKCILDNLKASSINIDMFIMSFPVPGAWFLGDIQQGSKVPLVLELKKTVCMLIDIWSWLCAIGKMKCNTKRSNYDRTITCFQVDAGRINRCIAKKISRKMLKKIREDPQTDASIDRKRRQNYQGLQER